MKDFLQGKWLGHPLHPAIVHLPTALWPTAMVFDILTNLGIGDNALFQAAFYAILLGLIAALFAVPFGLADWWGIRQGRPAYTLGVYHMVLNLIGTVLWSLNLGLRLAMLNNAGRTPVFPLVLSIAGVLILSVSGYLGGRMVYGYGVSVARLSKDKWRQIAESGGGRLPEK